MKEIEQPYRRENNQDISRGRLDYTIDDAGPGYIDLALYGASSDVCLRLTEDKIDTLISHLQQSKSHLRDQRKFSILAVDFDSG